MTAIDLQRQTLRLYGELLARSDVWGGKLVFTCGDGASATGLPAAVSIAGGTTLVLDSDSATVKAVFRSGGIEDAGAQLLDRLHWQIRARGERGVADGEAALRL